MPDLASRPRGRHAPRAGDAGQRLLVTKRAPPAVRIGETLGAALRSSASARSAL
jgi:hypothetical protein